MHPIVINEQFVHLFTFYLGGQLREGMRYQNDLYGLVCETDIHSRFKIYELATELAEQGKPVVITADGPNYAVWVSLRSPSYAVVIPTEELVQSLQRAA